MVIEPVAEPLTTPDIKMSMELPAGNDGIEPLTLLPTTAMPAGQTAKLAVGTSHRAETAIIALGTISLNTVSSAAPGPLLLIRKLYVMA